MIVKKCKICRRLGEKLFIAGDRCASVKCAAVRKRAPQGRRGYKKSSEYNSQLKEKQKLKFLYGLREKQFKNYVKAALKKKQKDTAAALMESLESRLDNAAYRLGFARSRSAAKQMVSHGHLLVNDKKTSIPSFRLRVGDRISIKENSQNKQIFRDLDIILKRRQPSAWLKLDKVKKEGEVISKPSEQKDYQIDTKAIIEFYLR